MDNKGVFDSFDTGWNYAKKHGLVLSVILFAIYLLVSQLFTMCFPEEFLKVYMKVIQSGDIAGGMVKLNPYIENAMPKIWLVSILQFALNVGVVNVAKANYDGVTERISLKYLSLPLASYIKMIGIFCMLMLISVLGLYLFGLPTIYLGTRMLFVIPAVLENPDIPLGIAFRNSWNLSKGRFWKLLGFECLCLMVMLVGAICLFVGLFFAAVVCIYAWMDIYKVCKEQDAC